MVKEEDDERSVSDIEAAPCDIQQRISMVAEPHGHALFASPHIMRGPRGHEFGNIEAKGKSRTHLGDAYNMTTYINTDRDSHGEKRPTIRDRLKFDGMADRLASVSSAYFDTCCWVFNRPEYDNWRDLDLRISHNGVLWIKGKAGSGKSTMMKCLLNHAEEERAKGSKETVISFFFNARSPDVLLKSAEGMYRSLLYQTFEAFNHLEERVPAYIKDREKLDWSTEILEELFRRTVLDLQRDVSLACYIDALDECGTEDVRRAIGMLEDISESASSKGLHLWICISSRYYPSIKMRKHEEIRLEIQPEHIEDISRYVQTKLAVASPLKTELMGNIKRRCFGVFLWVVLVVKILNNEDDAGSTPSELRAILAAVPDELSRLFDSILEGSDDALVVAMQCVLVSRRTLRLEELYFAIRASTGKLKSAIWQQADIDLQRMERFVVHTSRGLIELGHALDDPPRRYTHDYESIPGQIPPDSETRPPGLRPSHAVQFIHDSVREYLFAGGLAHLHQSLGQDVSARSHAEMSKCCQTYVQLGILDHYGFLGSAYQDKPPDKDVQHQFIGERMEKFPLVDYAMEHGLSHLYLALSGGALDFVSLGDFPFATYAMLRVLWWLDKYLRNRSASFLYHLVRYHPSLLNEAFLRVVSESKMSGSSKELIKRLLPVGSNTPILGYSCKEEIESPTRPEVYQQLLKFVTPLLGSLEVAAQAGRYYPSTIAIAALDNDLWLMRFLLGHKANPNVPNDPDIRYTMNPLQLAILHCHFEMEDYLLDQGAETNGIELDRPTARRISNVINWPAYIERTRGYFSRIESG